MTASLHEGPMAASAPQSERATLVNAKPTQTFQEDQIVTLIASGAERRLRWGEDWHVGSAAYWIARCREAVGADYRFSLGDTLVEEVSACILGGYGVPAEVGLAAFRCLRDRGLLSGEIAPSGEEIITALQEPVRVGQRLVHYRFAAQRGRRLAAALKHLSSEDPPLEALELRAWLLALPGVGPKTASWVVRNHLGCNEVAIIDVHVLRAGVFSGVFAPGWSPTRHYLLLEELFLAWARRGGVSPAALDAVIWADMAALGRSVHVAMGVPHDGWSWYAADHHR